MKVLVVEDSPLFQLRLTRMLEALDGVELAGCVPDTARAIALIDAEQPQLVVLDVELRGTDRGMDVLRHVVRRHSGIKVMALSNFGWGAMRQAFLAAGACAYFDKALEFDQARAWIREQCAPDAAQPH